VIRGVTDPGYWRVTECTLRRRSIRRSQKSQTFAGDEGSRAQVWIGRPVCDRARKGLRGSEKNYSARGFLGFRRRTKKRCPGCPN